MKAAAERKRKAEDGEPYNRQVVRNIQGRRTSLVAREVARRSLKEGKGKASSEGDLGFALPSSPSSPEMEAVTDRTTTILIPLDDVALEALDEGKAAEEGGPRVQDWVEGAVEDVSVIDEVDVPNTAANEDLGGAATELHDVSSFKTSKIPGPEKTTASSNVADDGEASVEEVVTQPTSSKGDAKNAKLKQKTAVADTPETSKQTVGRRKSSDLAPYEERWAKKSQRARKHSRNVQNKRAKRLKEAVAG